MQSKIKVGDIVAANKNYPEYADEIGMEYEVLGVREYDGKPGIFVYDPRSLFPAWHPEGSNGIFFEDEVDVIRQASQEGAQ